MCLLLSCVIWPSGPYLLFQFQAHWQSVTEVLSTMEKVGKESNKCYDAIMQTSDPSMGPSYAKQNLMSQMEDFYNAIIRVLVVLSIIKSLGRSLCLRGGSQCY